MRMVIAREGVATLDGRMIARWGLKWEPGTYPVTLDGHEQFRVVGTAEKIRRDEFGVITAEIDAVGIEGLFPQITCYQPIDGNPDPVLMNLKSLRLRGIAFGNRPAWEGLG